MASLEAQNMRISQVVEYLQQKNNEKDIDNKMLTKNVEGLTQENTSLKENIRQLNDEINQWKSKCHLIIYRRNCNELIFFFRQDQC